MAAVEQAIEQAGVQPGPAGYALVLKTHVWDPFIARALERYRAAAPGGDVFVYVDETHGPVGPIPHDRVIRATNADLLALGLADRAERGSLIWWNTDYPHYLFLDRFPGYAHYVFAEYDTCIQRNVDGLVADVAAAGADLVALPTRTAKQDWMWTPYHARTYREDEIEGSLNCICILSNRGLRLLSDRRLEMSRESALGNVAFWPMNEVFLATEIRRAGLSAMSLAAFGNADSYEWYPPHLEDDLSQLSAATFLHPVLDRNRYVLSLLKFSSPLAFFLGRSRVRRALRRYPEFRPMVARAFSRRVAFRSRELLHGTFARLTLRRAG